MDKLGNWMEVGKFWQFPQGDCDWTLRETKAYRLGANLIKMKLFCQWNPARQDKKHLNPFSTGAPKITEMTPVTFHRDNPSKSTGSVFHKELHSYWTKCILLMDSVNRGRRGTQKTGEGGLYSGIINLRRGTIYYRESHWAMGQSSFSHEPFIV